MTRSEQIIILGLASIQASLQHSDPISVLKEWENALPVAFPTTEKTEKKSIVTDADVQAVYDAYPTKDENNRSRPLGKGKKSKAIIRGIMERGEADKETLINAIREYLEASRSSGTWLKDFNTFLNNLPLAETERETKPRQEYRLQW